MQNEERIADISVRVRGRLFRVSPFWLIVMAFAALKLLVHLFTATNYGYLCDELYAIDLSKHLAFGYVDMPPILPALLALSRAMLGDSLLAIHILPALAGSATLVVVCLITRELGGRLYAAALSAAAFLVTPFWLMMDSIFGCDSFDQLALAAFLLVLVRLIRSDDARLWLVLGLVGGVACMTKVTILYWAPGLLAALLVSRQRRQLLTPWPWAGLGVFLCDAEYRWIPLLLPGHTAEGGRRKRTCLAGRHKNRRVRMQSTEFEPQGHLGVFEALHVGRRRPPGSWMPFSSRFACCALNHPDEAARPCFSWLFPGHCRQGGKGAVVNAPGGRYMIDPVKSGTVPPHTSSPAKAAAPQAAVGAKPDLAKSDTVQLSNEAQARSLRQSGLSIPEIALQLRLDIKTVNGFFPLSKS